MQLPTFLILIACSATDKTIVQHDERTVLPSFVCDNDLTEVERAICRDEGLAELDNAMAELYDRRVREAPEEGLQSSQVAWLEKRDHCLDRIVIGADDMRACIGHSYEARLRTLAAPVEPLSGLFAQGELNVESPEFEGLSVASILPDDEYGVMNLDVISVAGNLMRASCVATLWTREIGGERLASSWEDGPRCIAKVSKTHEGIQIDISEGCHGFCGAAAGWGGEYRRVAGEEAERWERFIWY